MSQHNKIFDPSFTMSEISNATGVAPETLCGGSYAAKVLDIPLQDGRILRFREGDDPTWDHSVEIHQPTEPE